MNIDSIRQIPLVDFLNQGLDLPAWHVINIEQQHLLLLLESLSVLFVS